jgi:hypothetical protein
MSALEVLVIFHCRTGETEHRALAAALGAVQGKATIRLRRLADGDGKLGDAEAVARMCKEYVPPNEADVVRADAVIVVPPPDFTLQAAEWDAFLSLLSRLGAEGNLRNKLGLVSGTDDVVGPLTSVLQNAGLVVMEVSAENPIQQGRELVVHAQALKQARSGA